MLPKLYFLCNYYEYFARATNACMSICLVFSTHARNIAFLRIGAHVLGITGEHVIINHDC